MTSLLFLNPDTTPDELFPPPPSSSSSSSPNNNKHDNAHNDPDWPWDNNSTHNNSSRPKKLPSLARLNILQGFALLGGGGFLTHEIHAIEYQKALALPYSNNSPSKQDTAPLTTDMATTTTEELTRGGEGEQQQQHHGEPSQLWPWSWAQKLQSVTTGSRGTMKRYRITIEELPGEASPADATTATSSAGRLEDITSGAGQGEGEEEETAVKKVATTTAMMPTGVVDWLLNVSYDKPYGFRLPAAEETEKKKEWDSRNESGDESTEAIAEVAVSAVATGDVGIEDVVPQVPLPEQEASSSTVIAVLAVPSQQAPPTPESAPVAIAATEPAVATKIEALSVPVAAVATVVAASNTKANADAPVNAKPTEAALSSTSPSSSVLVNKVMEVRPSWDRQDQTAATSINNAHQDSSRTRQWPPRRRHSESFTQTTITHPDGTTESKTVTFNRHTGVTETHTRIQRPDGSFIESSTHRTNPSHVSSPSQGQEVSRQQQVQQTPQTQCKGGNPYRNHLNRVAAQQQQQGQQGQGQQAAETIASAPLAPAPTVAVATPTHAPTPTPSHRPSFKERWNQRRQEHREFLEELRAEREHEREQHTSAHTHATKDQQQQQHKEQQQSERGRRERRQELRDAEARQREAIAAAYGFVPTSPPPSSTPSPPSSASASSSTSSTSSNWSRFDRDHDQDRDHGRRHHRKRHEEEDNYDNERSRSWPPKGYLKRQEREREQQQEQPRHNV